MKWRQLGGSGNIIKWDTMGQVVEGLWRGTHDGKFGLLGTLEQPDGKRVSFSMSAILADRLGAVEDGDEVRIVFQGQGKTKGGQRLNLFEVYVADPDEEITP